MLRANIYTVNNYDVIVVFFKVTVALMTTSNVEKSVFILLIKVYFNCEKTVTLTV